MLTIKDIFSLASRFIFTLVTFAAATVHTVLYAVPEASRPAAVVAAIASGLVIAMYDSGVFDVEVESDLTIH